MMRRDLTRIELTQEDLDQYMQLMGRARASEPRPREQAKNDATPIPTRVTSRSQPVADIPVPPRQPIVFRGRGRALASHVAASPRARTNRRMAGSQPSPTFFTGAVSPTITIPPLSPSINLSSPADSIPSEGATWTLLSTTTETLSSLETLPSNLTVSSSSSSSVALTSVDPSSSSDMTSMSCPSLASPSTTSQVPRPSSLPVLDRRYFESLFPDLARIPNYSPLPQTHRGRGRALRIRPRVLDVSDSPDSDTN